MLLKKKIDDFITLISKKKNKYGEVKNEPHPSRAFLIFFCIRFSNGLRYRFPFTLYNKNNSSFNLDSLHLSDVPDKRVETSLPEALKFESVLKEVKRIK